jgi:hypothetical protein
MELEGICFGVWVCCTNSIHSISSDYNDTYFFCCSRRNSLLVVELNRLVFSLPWAAQDALATSHKMTM